MMRHQITLWTALPNGLVLRDGRPYLRLSVHVAPQLETDEGNTLDLFPEWLAWPDTLAAIGDFTIAFGSTQVSAVLDDPAALRPDIWAALFKPDTFLRPFEFQDWRGRLVVSHPASRILDYIKNKYQIIGFTSPNSLPELDAEGGYYPYEFNDMLNDLAFPWDREWANRLREILPRRRPNANTIFGVAGPLDLDGDGIPDDVAGVPLAAPESADDFARLKLFHTPPEKLQYTEAEEQAAYGEPYTPLPDDFSEYLDFHQAIASLADYPALLRMLGLVFDLYIPAEEVPTGEQLVQVIPNWAHADDSMRYDHDNPATTPYTAFLRDDDVARFTAQPRAWDVGPHIFDGFLELSQPDYDLIQVDVDGAALKLINEANTEQQRRTRRGTDSPTNIGMTTLRSAGLSLNRTDRAYDVYDHFYQTADNRDRMAYPHELILYAEDLLRGYRVDVWDSSSGAWHSLCRRVGQYSIEGTGITLNNIEDEGFTKMAVTQQAETEEGVTPASDDLYLHESLFRWDGWSLVAPRPGKVIVSPVPDDPLETPANEPVTPFKLTTSFRPVDRSLPRLRFGMGYRMRVRVVDIAGNSPDWQRPNDFAAMPPVDEMPVVYLRYEPVGSPFVALRAMIGEEDPGESLARLVIRTFNDDPSKDDLPTDEVNERHIGAPRSSPQMLETHGVFDDVDGRLRNDAQTYQMIAARDITIDPTDKQPPVYPQPQLTLPYLPDPLAAGAAFRDLPGAPEAAYGTLNPLGQLLYNPIPGVDTHPDSVTQIPYGPPTEGTISLPVSGLQALYTFDEGSGNIVRDVSGVGEALDLMIADPGNVTWGNSQLRLNASTIITSAGPATKLTSAVGSSGAVTLMAWITPASASQTYPARVMTLSNGTTARNFTLLHGLWEANERALYAARLLTSDNDANALPSLVQSPANSAAAALTHVVFTRSESGAAVLYLNGVQVFSGSLSGAVNTLDPSFRFALGNEFSLNRGWLGTFHLVAVYNRALTGDEVRDVFEAGVDASPPLPLLIQVVEGRPFRLALGEASDVDGAVMDFLPPTWDDDARLLTVHLPKAETAQVMLSSYMRASDLKLMGIWEWFRELIDQFTNDYAYEPESLAKLAYDVVNLTQYAKEGGHWMLTPARALTFVHAVQQPLGHPLILELLTHRQPRATDAAVLGRVRIHGKSTGKLDLVVQWDEPLDPLDQPAPLLQTRQAQVAEIPVTLTGAYNGEIYLTKQVENLTKLLGIYEVDRDTVRFQDKDYPCGEPCKESPNNPSAHPTHEFGDTKHRDVYYQVVSSSRFREYFTGLAEGFTRVSEEYYVNVPSTERPAPPDVRYVLPTYGWKRDTTTNLVASHRKGGGLRVYLGRPWFSSGDDELLGVVMWQSAFDTLDNDARDRLKNYITQWGMDPIWGSGNLARLPAQSNFPQRLYEFDSLDTRLPELPTTGVPAKSIPDRVQVAGHAVQFDEERGLWFCDIEVMESYSEADDLNSYTPFIRLALARLQPYSLPGQHLSRVVMADFAQLAPNRSAILTHDPYQAGKLTLTVSGLTYRQTAAGTAQAQPVNDTSFFQVTVEQRHPQIDGELGWLPTDSVVTTEVNIPGSGQVLWRGQINLPADRKIGDYRLVIREFERLWARQPLNIVRPLPGLPRRSLLVRRARLVYVDTLVL